MLINMNPEISLILTLCPIVLTYPQSNTLDEFKKIYGIEVNLRQDSTIEVIDKKNNERYLKNISTFPDRENPTEANLILELDTVNLSYYDNLYRSWGKIEAWNPGTKYIVLDSNGNNKNEIYAQHLTITLGEAYSVFRIYERIYDSLYTIIYESPDSNIGIIYDVGDITYDGLLDLSCRGGENSMRFFKQESINNLIIESNFIYNPFPPQYQHNTPTFYDIDSDGNLEIIYFLDAGDGDSVWAYSNHIAKYNPQINNYELIYHHRPLPDFYTYGISTGDFDQDAKGNFGTGSIYGKFYIYEYVQGNQFTVEFEDTLQTYNAYLTTFTDDMDGNGKPEIWIGGDFNSSLYGGVTRVYAFESNGPESYKQIYQIDIRGLFAFTTGKMRYCDLDYDGKKDLFLANGDFVFGIKNNGVGSYYFDFVKLLPLIDTTYASQYIWRVDVADLDGDNIWELISQHELYFSNQTSKFFSVFFKRNKISEVDEIKNQVPNNYEIFQNYPNPFNPDTKIEFTLPSESNVFISIYNIVGEEIKKLLIETRLKENMK